jgi:hypothetical protein
MLLAARDEDLARSGLGSPATRKRLGIGEPLSVKQTEARTGVKDAASYEIPYHDVRGKRVEYTRLKLIPMTDSVGIRYWQEEKTIPRIYVPPLTDWVKIAQDPRRLITITEGEKKAACATLLGMPTLGLGGVWSWKSKRWGLSELTDFDWFEWSGRDVEICYDGDLYSNEDVATALRALTGTLTKRGARVFVRYLPTTDGISKMDDFLVARGVEAYQRLERVESDNSRELVALNDRVAYLENLNAYVSIHDGLLLKTDMDVHRKFGTTKINSDSGKEIQATKVWMSWPHRRTLLDVTYAPAAPRIVDNRYNYWNGWGVKPRRGSCSELLTIIRSMEASDWFLRWLAYPIQNPGAKMHSASVVWSIDQGTGKSFIGDIMRDIYGENSAVITSGALHDERYEWARRVQFVVGEEVNDYAGRADYNALKSLITGERIRLNPKYSPSFELPNTMNLYFTSNNPDAMKIDTSDRRFFVSRLDRLPENDTPTKEAKFWRDMGRWRKSGGASHFMNYLLKEVDCSGFNTQTRPPVTHAKTEMIHSSMSGLEQWCAHLIADPDAAMEEALGDLAKSIPRGRDVFTVAQIAVWLPEELRETKNVTTLLGKALERVNAVKFLRTVKVDGKVVRLVAIRNIKTWKSIDDPREWAANYEGKMTRLRRG